MHGSAIKGHHFWLLVAMKRLRQQGHLMLTSLGSGEEELLKRDAERNGLEEFYEIVEERSSPTDLYLGVRPQMVVTSTSILTDTALR